MALDQTPAPPSVAVNLSWPAARRNSGVVTASRRPRWAARLRFAQVCLDRIASGEALAKWSTDGTLEPHTVLLVHFPKAHVYGVASTRTSKGRARVLSKVTVVQEVTVANKYIAILAKELTLATHHQHRCVAAASCFPAEDVRQPPTSGGSLPGDGEGRCRATHV